MYSYNLLYILYIWLVDPSLAGEPDTVDARMREDTRNGILT